MIPLGYFDYSCQDDLVCKVQIEDVPYFNAPIYLENKESIGKIDEIFGTLRDYYVSIKLGENMKASSFKHAQKVRGRRHSVVAKPSKTNFVFTLFASCLSIRQSYCRCSGFCQKHHSQKVRSVRVLVEAAAVLVDEVVEDEAAVAAEDLVVEAAVAEVEDLVVRVVVEVAVVGEDFREEEVVEVVVEEEVAVGEDGEK